MNIYMVQTTLELTDFHCVDKTPDIFQYIFLQVRNNMWWLNDERIHILVE